MLFQVLMVRRKSRKGTEEIKTTSNGTKKIKIMQIIALYGVVVRYLYQYSYGLEWTLGRGYEENQVKGTKKINVSKEDKKQSKTSEALYYICTESD